MPKPHMMLYRVAPVLPGAPKRFNLTVMVFEALYKLGWKDGACQTAISKFITTKHGPISPRMLSDWLEYLRACKLLVKVKSKYKPVHPRETKKAKIAQTRKAATGTASNPAKNTLKRPAATKEAKARTVRCRPSAAPKVDITFMIALAVAKKRDAGSSLKGIKEFITMKYTQSTPSSAAVGKELARLTKAKYFIKNKGMYKIADILPSPTAILKRMEARQASAAARKEAKAAACKKAGMTPSAPPAEMAITHKRTTRAATAQKVALAEP